MNRIIVFRNTSWIFKPLLNNRILFLSLLYIIGSNKFAHA